MSLMYYSSLEAPGLVLRVDLSFLAQVPSLASASVLLRHQKQKQGGNGMGEFVEG